MPNSSEKQTLQILKENKAIIDDDYFVYISGEHGKGWINKDVIFPNPQLTLTLSKMLAEKLQNKSIDIIVGPTTGGLILGQWLAYHLNCQTVFAEHDEARDNQIRGDFVLRRNYDKYVKDKNVLVVDDIINTGHSIQQTLDAVKKAGGNVSTIATIVDRGNVTLKDFPGIDDYDYLLQYDIPSWPEDKCELCQNQTPINIEYAHGKEFVEMQKRK